MNNLEIIKKLFIFLLTSFFILSLFYVFSYLTQDLRIDKLKDTINELESNLIDIKVNVKIKQGGETKNTQIILPNSVVYKNKNGLKLFNISLENGFLYKVLDYQFNKKQENILYLYDFPIFILKDIKTKIEKQYKNKKRNLILLEIIENYIGKEQLMAMFPFVNPTVYFKIISPVDFFIDNNNNIILIAFKENDKYIGLYWQCQVLFIERLGSYNIACIKGTNKLFLNRVFKQNKKSIHKKIKYKYNGKLIILKPYNAYLYDIKQTK